MVNKPKNCLSCWFNISSIWCRLTGGEIDRDDGSCNIPCPIKQVDEAAEKIIIAALAKKILCNDICKYGKVPLCNELKRHCDETCCRERT